MAKRIRHVSNLPEWFDLARYAGAESLDTAGWYEQLSVRRDLIGLIGSPRWESWQANAPPKTGQQAMRVLALIRATPIVDIAKDELLMAYFYGGALHELKALDPRYSFGVHLTTVRNLYLTENNIEKDKRAYARNFFVQMFGNAEDWTTPLAYKYKDWIDEPIDGIADSGGFDVNIRVNMLLPDKVLIEQFKRVLNELRSPLQRVGFAIENTRKPDCTDWVRFGVLPYLDLQIWQHEAGVKIPNRVMADAIFPPGEGGEEVVRKTTAKLADDLLTMKHLATLAAIAAHEIAERNSV